MKEKLKEKYVIISISILSIIVLILFSSMSIVKSGEVGVKVRFGKAVNTVSEGINFHIPLIEKIDKLNIKVQKIDVRTDSSSKDLQDVDISLAVNYKIDNENSMDLYKNVGTNYEEIILQPAIEESIKAITSKYTAEELITNRSEVSLKCTEELDKKVSKYGILVSEFNITNFKFSEEFEKAIEEKQVAEQKVLTAKQELEKEKIESEKKIVLAEAEKKANELKEKSLTDNIIKEKFIEKWDGVLPKVTGSNSIIDINDIIKGD